MFEQISLFDLNRKGGWVVERIDRERAKPFIESIHYSRVFPNNIVYCFGMYDDGELIGVVTYGIPASPNLCYGLAGKENEKNVLELNRLAIKPNRGGWQPSELSRFALAQNVATSHLRGELCGYWMGSHRVCLPSNEFPVHRDVCEASRHISTDRKT